MKYLFKAITNRHFLPLLIVLFFAILASRTLLFQDGYFNMHDDLQMMRQLQMEKCFLDFQIPCRWVPDMGYEYGFPLFNFYPPLPYLIGELVRFAGFSFITTVKLTFALSIIVSAITMYLLAKEFFGRVGGVLSSVFYVWAPYRAVDVYVRGAMNESWAIAWFPLIMWASYKLVISEKKERIKWVITLALSYSALLTSHNLMLLIFTPILVLTTLYWLWSKNLLRKLPEFILSAGLALGLAAFFTIPALLENEFTQIEYVLNDYFEFSAHFVNLKQLFISRFWGYGGSVWGIENDGMSFSIGQLHWLLSIFIGIPVLLKLLSSIATSKNKINEIKHHPVLITVSIMFFTGWIGAFLAHSRSTPIWLNLPQLQYLQFPWRFLSIIVFAFAFMVGIIPSAIARLRKYNNLLIKIISFFPEIFVTFVLIIILVIYSWKLFLPKDGKMGPLTDNEKFSGEAWRLQTQAGILDYLPDGVRIPPESKRESLVEAVNGDVEFDNIDAGTDWVEFRANVKSESGSVKLGVFDFPGWAVAANGENIDKYISENDQLGRISFDLPNGIHQVRAEFKNTPVRDISNAISVFSVLILISLIYFQKISSKKSLN
jgi:hypothetical protein